MPPPDPTAPSGKRIGKTPEGRGRSSGQKANGTAAQSSDVKLVCLAGPRSGEEFVLRGQEVVIGRSTDSAITIPDTSVSRRHVLLRKVPGGWAITDLGSGNGTLLNGEPVTEEMPLRNGDRLICGDTELSFVDAANSTDRRPFPVRAPGSSGLEARPRVARRNTREFELAERRRHRRLRLYAATFLVLCLGILVGLKVKQRAADRARESLELRQQAVRAQAGELFQQAKALVRQNQWAEALPKFQEAKRLEPGNSGVDDYLRAADREVPIQRELDAAEGAIAHGGLSVAQKTLAAVPKDTAHQFERRRQLESQLEAKVTARLAEATRTAEIARKLSSGSDVSKWVEVVEMTDEVLAVRPDNRDAKVLNDRAKEAIAARTAPKPKGAPPPPAHPWDEAIAQFSEGDIPGALSAANACAPKFARCKAVADEIGEFSALNRKLDDLDAKGLEQLLSVDAKITGGPPSKLARAAGGKAASIYYRAASAAKVAGQWGRALSSAQRALKADPSYAPALALVSELRLKGRDLYFEAYSLRDSNPDEAIRMFKDVLAMTPADDDSHRKAQQRLDQLVR